MRYRAPKWLTVALVLGLLLSASVFLLVRSAGFRTWLTRRAERSLSGLMAAGVEMGGVEGDVLGGVSVVGLSLRDAQDVEVLRAEEATVRWSWQSLLTGSPLIKEIRTHENRKSDSETAVIIGSSALSEPARSPASYSSRWMTAKASRRGAARISTDR